MPMNEPPGLPLAGAGSQIPYSTAPATNDLPPLVCVSVRGVPVRVECPSWCVTDHATEPVSTVADIFHYGHAVKLTMPVYGGRTETVLVAHLALWPAVGCGDEEEGTYVAVDVDGSGEVSPLYRESALTLADRLEAHATHIRLLALRANPVPAS
ncbi:DUF6907 domain-containing protein [Streptomyces rimosus]|uniref:DUF6907 domain-containing protein n=1 Tax=Streptomyces rimosus TaxID=1927 RepID=UPI0037B58B91